MYQRIRSAKEKMQGKEEMELCLLYYKGGQGWLLCNMMFIWIQEGCKLHGHQGKGFLGRSGNMCKT